MLDVLERINDGDDVENVLNVDNKTSNVTLADFKDSLDLTQPILCGENKIAPQNKVKWKEVKLGSIAYEIFQLC